MQSFLLAQVNSRLLQTEAMGVGQFSSSDSSEQSIELSQRHFAEIHFPFAQVNSDAEQVTLAEREKGENINLKIYIKKLHTYKLTKKK